MAEVHIPNSINKSIDIPHMQLTEFCKRWKISELAVFGSVLTDNFGADSDIDFLVTFASSADWSLLDHVQMEEELHQLVNRNVDLVSRRAIERSDNEIRRKSILESAQVLYAA